VIPAGKKIACVVYSSRAGRRRGSAIVSRMHWSGGVVVADGLDLARDEPLAGAEPRPRAVLPELLGLDAHPLRPVRPEQHDVAGPHVLGAALEILGRHLAVGVQMGEIDHGRLADPLVDGHRGHLAPVDQEMQRRVDVDVRGKTRGPALHRPSFRNQ